MIDPVDYIDLAFYVVNKMGSYNEEAKEEDRAEAMVGLCKAVARFDPSRGVKPSTYLVPYIQGAVLDGRRKRADGTRRLPQIHLQIKDIDFVRATAEKTEEYVELYNAISKLPPREQEIIHRHFFKDTPLIVIGEEDGLTKSRISQIKKKAIDLLRGMLLS